MRFQGGRLSITILQTLSPYFSWVITHSRLRVPFTSTRWDHLLQYSKSSSCHLLPQVKSNTFSPPKTHTHDKISFILPRDNASGHSKTLLADIIFVHLKPILLRLSFWYIRSLHLRDLCPKLCYIVALNFWRSINYSNVCTKLILLLFGVLHIAAWAVR